MSNLNERVAEVMPRYREQGGCHNCQHVVVIYDYDEPNRLFCNVDKSKRPPCGSVGMRENWVQYQRYPDEAREAQRKAQWRAWRQWIDGRMVEEGDRFACQVGWDDIPHLSEKEKAELILSIPKHQRDARSKGYPTLGAGAVYTYSEDDLVCEPFEVPPYYWGAYGMDVGWNCTAAVFIRYDRDNKTYYVVDEHKMGEASPADHSG